MELIIQESVFHYRMFSHYLNIVNSSSEWLLQICVVATIVFGTRKSGINFWFILHGICGGGNLFWVSLLGQCPVYITLQRLAIKVAFFQFILRNYKVRRYNPKSAFLFEVFLSSSSHMHWQYIEEYDGLFFSKFFLSWHLLSSSTRLHATWCMFTYIILIRQHKKIYSFKLCAHIIRLRHLCVWQCRILLKKLCLYNLNTISYK
jgi:hypothetical protein